MLTDKQLKQLEDRLFNLIMKVDAPDAVAELTGTLIAVQSAQLSRREYDEWVASQGEEVLAPGVHITPFSSEFPLK